MNKMLNAQNLHWQAGNKNILQDVSLTLHSGELLGIIGPNGAGKSSLLKMLARVREPDRGQLQLGDSAYRDIPARDFARRLAWLEQKGRVYWPLLVERVLQLGRLPHQGLQPTISAADQAAIAAAVTACGIETLLPRLISELSEGERMLVALARVLATDADILIADEPVASLDPYHQLLIMQVLRDRCQQSGRAGIVVLHDLSLAARFCERLLLMHNGRILAEGAPATVLTAENLRKYYGINAYIDTATGIVQAMHTTDR